MKTSRLLIAAAVAICAAQVFAIADSAQFKFKKGINFSGLEDGTYSSYDSTRRYLGQDATYTAIKSKGFDHVRLAVDFRRYYTESSQTLKSSISNVDMVVDKCEANGLYVFLDFHGWATINTTNGTEKATFLKIWELVADHYKDRSDYVIFELLNEPHTTEGGNLDSTYLNALQAEVMPIIRQTNPNRLVLLAAAEWNGPWKLSELTIPSNPGPIGVVCHTYAPMAFTHQGATWGGYSTAHVSFTSTDKTSETGTGDLDNAFRWIDDFQEKTGIPVVMNEFGVNKQNSKATDEETLDWTTYVARNCESNGIAWTWWEYNRGMGAYYNNNWRAPVMNGLFPAEPAGNTYTNAFNEADYAKKLTISFPGYAGGSALADFPVLVKLSSSIPGFSYGDFARANGDDLRFTDASGNLIPHEVDTWNPSGVSTVWVRVPSLTSATTIQAHYGCALPVAVDSSAVWTNGYVGVWHLGEGGLPLRESSQTSTDFTKQNGSGIAYAQAGIVGGSVDFGKSGNGRMVTAHDCDALDGFTNFTVEAWTYQTSNTTAAILSKRYSSSKNLSYFLYCNGSKTQFNVAKTDSTSGNSAQLTPSLNQWTHQSYTFSSGTIKAYMNGAKTGNDKTVSFSEINASDGYLHLGNFNRSGASNADSRNFPGKIDEVRISNVARSADWLRATHDTVANADFATYAVDGATPPDPERILYVNVAAGATNTLDAALVTASITNIVKQGAGTLVSAPIAGYSHTITVEAGVLQGGASADDFGAPGVVIDVKSGASLALRGATANGLDPDVLSGKTVNLYGAKEANTRAKIYVYNDAPTTIGPNVTIRLKDADSILYLDCAAWRVFHISSGTIDLGGHKLTISSNWRRLETGVTIVNGGTFELVYTEFYVAENDRIPTFSGTGTLKTNYVLNFKKLVLAPGWTLSGSPVTLHGNLNRQPTTTDYPVWSGPVEFAGNSKVADYVGTSSGTSNTVFNLKGAVSGSGTLSVGPGWLNLHNTANSYTGKVTVTGQAAGAVQPILAGGGGIGLWNGAACFPDASSITFTNTARLAFMDSTACSVPNVTFIALAGETQSISGGVHTARSTMAGFVKEGAGTLVVDSPVQVTGLADVRGGTLKVANRVDAAAPDLQSILAPMPQFSDLRFVSGTTLDLSDSLGAIFGDICGSPSVTNAGTFCIAGKWTLPAPGQVMRVQGENVTFPGALVAAGVLGFMEGATFDLADEAAFTAAAAGGDILVAEANWVMHPEESVQSGMNFVLPAPASTLSNGWSMVFGGDGKSIYLHRETPTQVTFAHEVGVTFSGYTGGAALTDFPVLVRLSPNIAGFSYSGFSLPGGGDLRFFDASGNLLSHEIDTWNEGGVSTAWVKVPSLTSATTITAKYGCTGTPPAVDPKDVWDDDYVGVWHLGEGALPLKESSETSSAFTAAYGDTIGFAADGVVGGSVDFPAGGQYNSLVAPDHDALDGFSRFTIETWTFQLEHKHKAGILSKRLYANSEMAYYIFGYDSGGTKTVPICVGTNRNCGTDWTFNQAQTLGLWNHIAYSVDMTTSTSNVRAFKNGVMNGWVPSKPYLCTMPNCASDLILGNLEKGSKDNAFNGRIDEVRISKCVRSPAWIKATYETVTKQDFATYVVPGQAALSGYAAWMNANELVGAPEAKTANGIENRVRYAFDIAPEKGADEMGAPVLEIGTDTAGDLSVKLRPLAEGRGDVTYGVLATETLNDWTHATFVPYSQFTQGMLNPSAVKDPAPAQMFFKYRIDIQP